MFGRQIKTHKCTEGLNTISLEKLAVGNYILKIGANVHIIVVCK